MAFCHFNSYLPTLFLSHVPQLGTIAFKKIHVTSHPSHLLSQFFPSFIPFRRRAGTHPPLVIYEIASLKKEGHISCSSPVRFDITLALLLFTREIDCSSSSTSSFSDSGVTDRGLKPLASSSNSGIGSSSWGGVASWILLISSSSPIVFSLPIASLLSPFLCP